MLLEQAHRFLRGSDPVSDDIVYVDRPEGLARVAEAMRGGGAIAVDTESDSLHCYFEKVCFVQVKVGATIYLIDPLTLESLDPLRDAFASTESPKLFHGADYDVLCMSRDFGFRFGRVIDTMVAAQFVGRENLGLAALCRDHFGVELDKSLTRHNWALRPVEEPYLGYMADDVRYLEELVEILLAEVAEADLEEEYEAECGWLATQTYREKPFDEEAWRKIKGARDLDPPAQLALKALYLMRDEIARRRDDPPYRVLGNEILVQIARQRPQSRSELDAEPRGRRARQRWSHEIMDALDRAAKGEIELPAPSRPTKEQLARRELNDQLRRWRSETARKDKRPSVVVMPKHALSDIVRAMPRTLDELAQIPFITEKRVERYGDAILDILDEF
jgi:ribonuclease D